MLYCPIPGLHFSPSVICLGVAEYGSNISTDDSFALLDDFADAGGNGADTAHVYAAWLLQGAGQSERTLGQWLRTRRPPGFFVATKGGHPDLATNVSRLTPECIAQDVQESLERLQMDAVDLYWLHRDDPQVPVGEIVEALDSQLRAGHLRALGASNWSVARLEAANAYAAEHGLTGFCASQIGWSLAAVNPQVRGANQTVQMDVTTLAWHRASGFPVMAYSAQANGFFHYPLPDPDAALTPKQQALEHSYLSPRNRERHERATQLAARLGHTTAAVALAYVWSQEFPAVAIIGARQREQLHDSLRAADLRLKPEEVAFLEND